VGISFRGPVAHMNSFAISLSFLSSSSLKSSYAASNRPLNSKPGQNAQHIEHKFTTISCDFTLHILLA
jgi:hypothetical protein